MLGRLLSLALRNVLRNKRRTMIAASAIGVGLAALIFTDGLIIGMSENLINSVTGTWLGDAQIHCEGYTTTYRPELIIRSADELFRRLEADPLVEAWAPRVMSQATIGSAADLRSVVLVGIDPEREAMVSRVDDSIVEGRFFEPGSHEGVILGAGTAEDLSVGPGDRVVITVAQVGTGVLYQDMLRVSGIASTGTSQIDEGLVFVPAGRAQEMLGLTSGEYQEVSIALTERSLAEGADSTYWAGYSIDGNLARGWPDLVPQLDAVLQMTEFSIMILGVILFGVVAFGIMNAIFMSIYERIFEFGVIRAVGTRAGNVLALVIMEAVWLAIISIVLGSVAGLGITWLVGQQGVDYTGIEMSGATFREPVYPVLRLGQFVTYPVWLLGLTALVGLYPAVHAARIKPAEAMRRSL